MRTIKLKDCLKFQQGANLSRLKKYEDMAQYTVYSQAHFDEDLRQIYKLPSHEALDSKFLDLGEMVISTTQQKISLVSSQHQGFLLPLNFIRASFTMPYLDKAYFLYLFNEHPGIKAQIEADKMGRSGTYKLSIKVLENLEVPLLPLNQQVKIGLTYLKMMSIIEKYQQQIQETKALTLAALEDMLPKAEG